MSAAAGTVAVHSWTMDGKQIGLGTVAEFNHWRDAGTMEDVTLGKVLGHEPAAEDARRAAIWGAQA